MNYNVFRRDQKEKLERNWLNFLFHIRPLAFLYCRTFFEKAMFCAMSKRKICVEETRVLKFGIVQDVGISFFLKFLSTYKFSTYRKDFFLLFFENSSKLKWMHHSKIRSVFYKMYFSIKDLFSTCEQILILLWIYSRFIEKLLMKIYSCYVVVWK